MTIQVTHRGYTLIETLVYIGVFVLVAMALVVTFLSFDTVFLRNNTERIVINEAQTSLEYIAQAIRQADSVNTGLSTFDNPSGVLVLNEGATSTRIYMSGGAVMLEVEGTSVGPLTSDAVTVDAITFNHYVGTITDLVRVSLTLSAQNKAASTTRTFYTSGVLRGSYE